MLIMPMMHDENDDEIQGKNVSVLIKPKQQQSLFHLLTHCLFH